MHVYIVAEIGCNHNGNPDLAKKMVLEAQKAGADAVKFQTFCADNLISKYAPKAEYQKINTDEKESQLEMTKKLELNMSDYLDIKKYCLDLGLDVFSTPFDIESIEFLEEAGQHIWKIPSGEITNLPYLEKLAKVTTAEHKIFMSTGMSTFEEIRYAIHILQKHGKKDITLLQCNTEYPSPDADMNLRSIAGMKEVFPDCNVGLSDHSVGYIAAIAAMAYEIIYLEKHFTLDKNFPGPDHKASATPEEFSLMCNCIRRTEAMLGEKEKKVSQSEKKNKFIARKSIVAKVPIKKGEPFTEDNITCKRPGNGISPVQWYKVLNEYSESEFKEDELITCKGILWEEDR